MQTRFYRDSGGWSAISAINFGDSHILQIKTSKLNLSDQNLTTQVTVWQAGFENHVPHSLSSDFSKIWAVSHPAQITESRVSAQHCAVLNQLGAIKLQVEKHYLEQTETANSR